MNIPVGAEETSPQPTIDRSALNASGGIASRTASRKLPRARLEKEALSRIKPAIAGKLSTSTGPVALELAWLESLLPKTDQPWEKRFLSTWLTNFLVAGIKDGTWSVDRLPPVIVKAPRQSSPFRPDRMTSARLVTAVRLRHEEHLAAVVRLEPDPEGGTSERQRLRAAQLVLSAMLYGGLVQSRLLKALPEKLNQPFEYQAGRLWIDFPAASGTDNSDSTGPQALRRWFPDPLTTCLLLRWRLDGLEWPADRGASLESLLLSYLRYLRVQFRFSGGGRGTAAAVTLDTGAAAAVDISERSVLQFLINGARAHLRLRVPPLIAEYAAGRNLATSLPAPAWIRMLTGRKLRCEAAPEPADFGLGLLGSAESLSLDPSAPEIRLPATRRTTEPSALLRRMTNGLSRSHKAVSSAVAQKNLRAFLADPSFERPPLLEALAGWALWSLKDRTVGQGAIRVSSLRTYLSAVATRMVEYGSSLTIAERRGDDGCAALLGLYDQVVESVRGEIREDCINRLAEFHLFLGLHYSTPPIQWRGRSIRAVRRVHANIVSELEFQALLRSIRQSDWPERRKDLVGLIAICAYRLGLRRREIIGRQLNCLEGHRWTWDLYQSIRPLLWIHATREASLKTRSSNRRSPLTHLLLREELDLLTRWADRRKKEVGPGLSGTELLFTPDSSANNPLADEDGFSEITEALRRLSGDQDLTFHNLRHSFVTLLISRLLDVQIQRRLNDVDIAPGLPSWSLPHSWAVPNRLSGQRLLQRLLLSSDVTRGTTYLISALVGHIDPGETVDSYSHSFDYLLHGYLSSELPKLTISSLSALGGVNDSASRVSRYRQRKSAAGDDAVSLQPSPHLTLASVLQKLIAQVETQGGFEPCLPTDDLGPHRFGGVSGPLSEKMSLPSLEELYALMLSTRTAMNPAVRAQLIGQPLPFVTALIEEARRCSSESLTAIQDEKRMRSRAIRKKVQKGKTKRVDPRQRPELTGMARALPKVAAELAQAKQVYESLTQQITAQTGLRMDAKKVFGASNRSGACLEIAQAETATALVNVLNAARISIDRLAVRVRSKPLAMSNAEAIAAIRSSLGVAKAAISFPEKPCTRVKHEPFPRIAVRLLGNTDRTGNAMFGWKVGLFYALVVAAACTAVGAASAPR